jgi:hypothetical protein
MAALNITVTNDFRDLTDVDLNSVTTSGTVLGYDADNRRVVGRPPVPGAQGPVGPQGV